MSSILLMVALLPSVNVYFGMSVTKITRNIVGHSFFFPQLFLQDSDLKKPLHTPFKKTKSILEWHC